MKSLFEETTYDEILGRLAKLTPESERQWGKMTASQMLEHTARAVEMATGRKPVKQALLGKAIGWIFKSSFLGEKPFPKDSPTGPDFIIKDEPDFPATKKRLTELITEFHNLGEEKTDGNIHGFFGRLSGKEWGETQYKHVDHHLRQFGL